MGTSFGAITGRSERGLEFWSDNWKIDKRNEFCVASVGEKRLRKWKSMCVRNFCGHAKFVPRRESCQLHPGPTSGSVLTTSTETTCSFISFQPSFVMFEVLA